MGAASDSCNPSIALERHFALPSLGLSRGHTFANAAHG